MFSNLGDGPGEVGLNLSDIEPLLQELKEFKESKLYHLLRIDLDAEERALMRMVKKEIPADVHQDKVREQAIGEANFIERFESWFDKAEQSIEEYKHKHEQQTNDGN